MGDNLGPNGSSSGCKVFCSRSMKVAHEADEPSAFVDLLDSQSLTGGHGRDVDALSIHADAAAGGDQHVAVVQGIGELR
jgi:hypothetical protein